MTYEPFILVPTVLAGVLAGLLISKWITADRKETPRSLRDPQVDWLLRQNAWLSRIVSKNLEVEPPEPPEDYTPDDEGGDYEETEAEKKDVFGWHRGQRV